MINSLEFRDPLMGLASSSGSLIAATSRCLAEDRISGYNPRLC
jgi:hypothetical protein